MQGATHAMSKKMNSRMRAMVGHGAILLAIGLLAGFGLAFTLIGGMEVFPGTIVPFEVPGDAQAWARTHTGGILNGIMVLVLALTMHTLIVPEKTEAKVYWMAVGAGYANTLFYWAGMFAGSRALTIGDNPLGATNFFASLGGASALVFAFLTIVALIYLATHAFRSST
ncbi:MAG: styrene-oxide isomerase StyC [Pseudomonadota bacterium]